MCLPMCFLFVLFLFCFFWGGLWVDIFHLDSALPQVRAAQSVLAVERVPALHAAAGVDALVDPRRADCPALAQDPAGHAEGTALCVQMPPRNDTHGAACSCQCPVHGHCVLIGACDPMACPIRGCRRAKNSTTCTSLDLCCPGFVPTWLPQPPGFWGGGKEKNI